MVNGNTVKYGDKVVVGNNEGKVINIQDDGRLAVVLLEGGYIRSFPVEDVIFSNK